MRLSTQQDPHKPNPAFIREGYEAAKWLAEDTGGLAQSMVPEALADWKNINRVLAESPMPAYDARLAKAYAQIGIGPGVDVEKMNPAVRRGLVRAQQASRMIVTSGPANNARRVAVNDRGEALNDSRRYVLRFSKGEIPQVNAFWSVTLYGPDFNFVDSSINRYAIGDRTRGLKYDADGGLTVPAPRRHKFASVVGEARS